MEMLVFLSIALARVVVTVELEVEQKTIKQQFLKNFHARHLAKLASTCQYIVNAPKELHELPLFHT